jgi:hypothetical protein
MPYRQNPFSRKLRHIASRLESERFKLSDPDDPPIIYHYTDPKGLIGILSEGQLWATNIRYLNDSSELLHAQDILKLVLGEIDQEFPSHSPQASLAAAARTSRSSLNDALDTYVTCFSAIDDLLYQWSMYGSGGSGFSIGFDRVKLEPAIRPLPLPTSGPYDWLKLPPPTVKLAKIRYAEDEQKRDLRHLFDTYAQLLSASCTAPRIARCAQAIADNTARSASLFKHPSFRQEEEWRIIISGIGASVDLHFRPSSRTPIPYVVTARPQGGMLPIVSITIGPTLHKDLSRRSVQQLLYAKGYCNVTIKESTLPLAVTC